MKKIFSKAAGWSMLVLLLVSVGFTNVSAKGRAVRVPSGATPECSSVLGDFADDAAVGPVVSSTDYKTMSLTAGVNPGSGWDSGASLTNGGGLLLSPAFSSIKVSATDSLPPGLTGFKTTETTYAKELTSNAVPGVSSKGPWMRILVTGTPTTVGKTQVKIKAEYTYNGVACTETGYINFNIKAKPAAYVPPPLDPATSTSTGGKIKFIKESLVANPKDYHSFMIRSIAVIKDKLVISGDCTVSPNLWVIKEDGSAVPTARDGCADATNGAWPGSGSAGGLAHSNILLNWGGDGNSFLHPIAGTDETGGNFVCTKRGPSGEPYDCEETYPGGLNYSVYYEMDSTGKLSIVSVSPEHASGIANPHYSQVVLKDRFITTEGKLLGLPDWDKLGTVSSPGTLGFGNFMIQKEGSAKSGTWNAYKISASGAKTLLQTLPVKGTAVYTFDNSVWPPRLAFWEFTNDSNKKGAAKVSIFRATDSDMVLDKTITIPEGTVAKSAVGSTPGPEARNFAVWGDYVLFVGNTATGSYTSASGAATTTYKPSIELWKNGQKIDELPWSDNNLESIGTMNVTQGGYLIVSNMARGQYKFLIYKIDGLGTSSPAGSFTNLPVTVCASGHTYNYITGELCAGANALYSIFNNAPASPAPKIGDVVGPTALSINTKGTWTITAKDSNNDDILWAVDWGSGKSPLACPTILGAGSGQGQTYTASHSWVRAGTYTVKFYVNDCKGGEAEKSFSVRVGGGSGSDRNTDNLDAY